MLLLYFLCSIVYWVFCMCFRVFYVWFSACYWISWLLEPYQKFLKNLKILRKLSLIWKYIGLKWSEARLRRIWKIWQNRYCPNTSSLLNMHVSLNFHWALVLNSYLVVILGYFYIQSDTIYRNTFEWVGRWTISEWSVTNNKKMNRKGILYLLS